LSDAYQFYQKAKALSENDQIVDDALSRLQADLKSSQGSVLTWGLGESYGLGHIDLRDKHRPTMVDGLRGKHILDISCGAMHTVAVTGTGEVYSWGQNKYGQVGIKSQSGDNLHFVVPRLVNSLFGVFVSAVSCGAGHTVVLSADGRAFSWGMGGHGQLGHGTHENIEIPKQIMSLGSHHIVAISCGIAHSIFLLSREELTGAGDHLMGCGMNTYGALGFKSETQSVTLPSTMPLPPQTNGSITHISCGGAHTAIVDDQGNLFLTGYNNCGQLGVNHPQIDFIPKFTLIQTVLNSSKVSSPSPYFVYVSCGEEFTLAITTNHRVYATGLGIAGQMGNGLRENNLSFTHIESLDSHLIEEICCSQGIVYGTTAHGEVWSWGVPGHEAKYMTMTSSDDQNSLIPQPYLPLKNRKKAVRMIRCGRKHYTVVTIIPYGPTSFVRDLDRSGGSNETNIIFEVGKKLKLTLQCCDINGSEVDSGGCAVVGHLTRMPTENDHDHDSLKGEREDEREFPLLIDDNFDGSFSIESEDRIKSAGEFSLSLMIDDLHTQGSPFQIRVQPGFISSLHCYLFSNTNINITEVRSSDEISTLSSNQLVHLLIEWTDKYGNSSPCLGEEESCELIIKVLDSTGLEVLTKIQSFLRSTLVKEQLIRTEFDGPSQVGFYSCQVALCISVTSSQDEHLIESTLPFEVKGSPYSRLDCEVTYPSYLSVDQEIISTLQWKDSNRNIVHLMKPYPTIHSTILSLSPSPSLSLSAPMQSNLSARALIQLYTWGQDPCKPVVGIPLLNESQTSSLSVSHKVHVSGRALLNVFVDNFAVHTSEICIHSGVVSPIFTELIRPRDALTGWSLEETQRVISFQLRDQYGNICDRTHDHDLEFFAEEWKGKETMTKRSLPIQHLSADRSVISIEPVVYDSDRSSEYWIDVGYLDEKDERLRFQYSPYCIGTTTEFDVIDSTGTMSQSSGDRRSQQMQLESLQRSERTKKRAADALKKKQRMLLEDKERNRIKRAARRTGGGFIVQYSQDI
jgi:alpha-tubulin suppressor-like RCC1 family protein